MQSIEEYMEKKNMVESKRRVTVDNVVFCVRPSKRIKGEIRGKLEFVDGRAIVVGE